MRRAFSFWVVAGAAAGTLACGAEPGELPALGASALKGAEPAPDAAQIFAIVNFAGGQCTGAPIAPSLVLTARHCIGRTKDISRRVVCTETAFTDPDSAGAVFVVTKPEISDDPNDYHRVRAVRMLPGDDERLCGRDLALLELAEPVDVPPLIPRIDAPPVPGESYTAYGYGDDEGEVGAGVRRSLSGLRVDCVAEGCPDREVYPTEWVGSDGVCSGDSGGPALDADGKILGVVSRGYTGCRAPVYASVPAFAEFLKSEALLAAEHGNYAPPAWALPQKMDEDEPDEPASTCAYGPHAPSTSLPFAWLVVLGFALRHRRSNA
jgi:hypothetical protein